MAVGEGRYNPIGYHVGTVWPFDNSFAWGLRLYGFKDEAAIVAARILEAARFSTDGSQKLSVAIPERQRSIRCSIPPPAARKRGLPDTIVAASDDARSGASRRQSGRRCRIADEHRPPGLLDIPGRWGRVDAFGRGRVILAAHGLP